jgi:hypothetical protein
MAKFLKLGDTVINPDHVARVELRKKAQHPDRSRWPEAEGKNGHFEAVRIQLAGEGEAITLFDDQAEEARKFFGDAENVTDLTPEKEEGEVATPETPHDSGILNSDQLHAATSAGQDRPGAADLRPPATRTTPPPGSRPDAPVIVPAKTAGLHNTPQEARDIVTAAETVRLADEAKVEEGRERAKDAPLYPSDRSGEGDGEGKPKDDDKGKDAKPTGVAPQHSGSLRDAPTAGKPKK